MYKVKTRYYSEKDQFGESYKENIKKTPSACGGDELLSESSEG